MELALDNIAENQPERYIIFLNSQSVFTSLKNKSMTNLLITKLLNRIYTLYNETLDIFCCIPSHIGIRKNRKADKTP